MNTQQAKERLEKERSELEAQLASIGRKNPENPEDWEAVEPPLDTHPVEEGDVAEGITEFENNSSVLDNLEIRLNEVKAALEKIATDTYGTCEVCGNPIEEDRLEANLAAKTCKTHM